MDLKNIGTIAAGAIVPMENVPYGEKNRTDSTRLPLRGEVADDVLPVNDGGIGAGRGLGDGDADAAQRLQTVLRVLLKR